MTTTTGIVWEWSLSETNVIYIFRDKYQDVKIYLDSYNPKAEQHKGVVLLKKERVFLNQLIEVK